VLVSSLPVTGVAVELAGGVLAGALLASGRVQPALASEWLRASAAVLAVSIVRQTSRTRVNTATLVQEGALLALGADVSAGGVVAGVAPAAVLALARLLGDRVLALVAGVRCSASPAVVAGGRWHSALRTHACLHALPLAQVLCVLATEAGPDTILAPLNRAPEAIGVTAALDRLAVHRNTFHLTAGAVHLSLANTMDKVAVVAALGANSVVFTGQTATAADAVGASGGRFSGWGG
jgi:hypothetical protein